MCMNNVASLAHKSAEKLIAGFAARRMPMTDLEGIARVAAGCDGLDPDSRDGQLDVDRMVGHFVNHSVGTSGY